MKKSSIFISVLAISMMMSSLHAAWTVEEYNQNYCTHKITDGNWEIGVYKYSDDKWSLGKVVGQNGSSYIAGSGVLDLRTVEADCGVVLKVSNNGALEKVAGMTEVYLPDSLESVNGNTFTGCTSLTNAVLGSGMKAVGTRMFFECSSLQKVLLPEGIEEIKDEAFDRLKNLVMTQEDFPSTITTIRNCAFRHCSKVTGDLVFPNLTTFTGGYHFQGAGVTSFTAPKLEDVPKGLFNDSKKFTKFVCSPNVTNIGYRAFQASGLRDFYPSELTKLKTLSEGVFRACGSLTNNFDLSQSELTYVPPFAFADLVKVKSIKFPKTLTELASESIGYNKSSRAVWFMGPPPTIGEKALYPNGGIWLIVAGTGCAAAWEKSENLIALEEGDAEKAMSLAVELGVTGVKPIGKWTYQTNGTTHWVMKELPKATVILVF